MDSSFSIPFKSHVILRWLKSVGQERLALVRRRHVSALCTAALLTVGGCASAPAPPPSEAVRLNLGHIGIRSGAASPSAEWNMPAKGGAAGAGRGAAAAALSVLSAPCVGYGCAANVLLAPVGAVLGGIAGGATAEPAAAVEEAEAAVRAAFADLKIPDTLRDRIVQVTRAETPYTLFFLQDDAAEECATRDNPARGADAMDTVLQINVQGYGTKAAWRPNPPIFLFLDANVRLLRSADNTVLYSRKAAWVSAGRPLAEWAGSNGDPVREELGRGVQYLAERIVDVVFLLKVIP